MSLRGLDSFITGHWGDDYWGNEYDEYYGTFICGFCIASDHKHCVSKHCGCPYRSPGDRTRMGREHQRKRGKLRLVIEQAPQRYAWDEPGWVETEDDAPLMPQGYKITGTMKVVNDLGEARSGDVTGAGQPDAVSSDDALGQVPASPDIEQPGPQEGAGLANTRGDDDDVEF